MKPILEVKNLSKSYENFELKNISFQLPKGSIMGFIGENGAGKTTTMKLILNQIHREAGSVSIFGLDNIRDEKKIKQELGVVFDESFFYGALCPAEIGKILGASFTHWDSALYKNYLEQFKLPEKQELKKFSRGMKMKLSLAAALSHHPKLLLLDEATSGLDPVVRGEILDVFLDFIQDEEHGILLSSHITSDLEKIADYITYIHRGELVFSESKDDILARFGVAHGTVAEISCISADYYMGSRKNRYGADGLVNDRAAVAARYPNLAIDPASLDDIMIFSEGEEKR